MKHITGSTRAESASRSIAFLALMCCLCLNFVKLPWQTSAAWAGNPSGDSGSHVENTPHAPAENIAAQGVGEHVRLVNHVGGAPGPGVIQGSYAYMSFSFELAVMDISDPTYPTRIGFLTLPFNIQQLCAYGDYVFAAGRANLAVIDASIPTNPVHVGSFSYLDYPTGLAANGSHIYLSAPPSIRIIDYTNPALPVQVADYTPPGNPGGLSVRDRYLYSAEGGDGQPVPQIWGGLRILDISDPRAPQEVSYSVTARIAADVVLVDSLAYVADYYSGLWIFDISNPYEPVKLGYTQIGSGGAGNLAVVGSTAYVTGWDGLAIVDVSDSTAPRVIGGYTSGGIVATLPGIVYLGRSSTLDVVDVSDPTQAVLVRTIGGLRWADGQDVQGNYIYVAEPGLGLYEPENLPGLWILDKSDPSQVQVASFFSEGCAGGGRTLEVSDGHAFMACKSRILQVYDIADPYLPVKLGAASFGGNARDIAINGDYAYIVSGDMESGLWIFDISNPATPELLSSYSIQAASSVVAGNPYVYVASGDGLQVFDITQPANPVLVNNLDEYDSIRLALAGQTLFMTGSRCDGSCDQGMYIFDISDPAAPELTGYFPTSSPPVGLDVAGGMAGITIQIQNYGTDIDKGELLVLSIVDPSNLYQVGWYPLYGYYDEEIVLDGQYIYSGGREGLFIMEYGYHVGGLVSDVLGRPYPGVTISAGQEMSATTGSDGVYQFYNMDPGPITLSPIAAGYAFLPPARDVQVPPDRSGANFTILPPTISSTLFPQVGSQLVYTDTQGLPTRFDFPAGSVTITSTLTITPTKASGSAGMAFAGHAFDLSYSLVGTGDPGLNKPATVTIEYSQADVSTVLDTVQLKLFWWDGSGWLEAQDTCPGVLTVSHDIANWRFEVEVCSSGKYALLGPTNAVFIPYIGHGP